MIHCIGDSHASIFSGNEEMQPIYPERSNDTLEWFKSYRIGPATAYQLENKIPIIDQILSKINITDGVLFCFGEVDIRAHLLKQAQISNRNIEDIVKECVDRYLSVILHYKNKGFNMIVWGPIASWSDVKPYLGGPSFSSNLERNNVTRIFNDYLKEQCLSNDIKFVSIFNNMLNEDNTTKHELLDDWEDCHIHLNKKAIPYIISEFTKQNLI